MDEEFDAGVALLFDGEVEVEVEDEHEVVVVVGCECEFKFELAGAGGCWDGVCPSRMRGRRLWAWCMTH